jgi:hypothetical protein
MIKAVYVYVKLIWASLGAPASRRLAVGILTIQESTR